MNTLPNAPPPARTPRSGETYPRLPLSSDARPGYGSPGMSPRALINGVLGSALTVLVVLFFATLVWEVMG